MWEQAVAVGAPIVGGILGNVFGSKDRKRAERLRQQMVDEYGNIDPNVLREIMAQEQQQSELANYNADPGMVQAQRSALGALQAQYEGGGYNAQDKANVARARLEAGREAQAGRQSVLASAQARGALGSGDVLASLLLGQQSAADQSAMAGMDAAAAASGRAQNAAAGMGQMAGNMRNQDFGEQQGRAQAMDAINRFNAEQRQNTNVYNMNNRQQNFSNRMQLSGARNNARQGQAQGFDASAGRTEGMWTGIGAGVGQGAGAYGQKKDGMARMAMMGMGGA